MNHIFFPLFLLFLIFLSLFCFGCCVFVMQSLTRRGSHWLRGSWRRSRSAGSSSSAGKPATSPWLETSCSSGEANQYETQHTHTHTHGMDTHIPTTLWPLSYKILINISLFHIIWNMMKFCMKQWKSHLVISSTVPQEHPVNLTVTNLGLGEDSWGTPKAWAWSCNNMTHSHPL